MVDADQGHQDEQVDRAAEIGDRFEYPRRRDRCFVTSVLGGRSVPSSDPALVVDAREDPAHERSRDEDSGERHDGGRSTCQPSVDGLQEPPDRGGERPDQPQCFGVGVERALARSVVRRGRPKHQHEHGHDNGDAEHDEENRQLTHRILRGCGIDG